jgi:hypothetical protein
MSFKGFLVNKYLKIVANTTATLSSLLTSNGEIAYDSTLDKAIVRSNSVNDPVVLEARAATLANKTLTAPALVNATGSLNAPVITGGSSSGAAISGATINTSTIDGDNNTISDISISSLKTVLGDANEFIARDGSGAVVSAKVVPAGAVVGTSDSQALSNKTISGGSLTSADIDGSVASNASRITLPQATKSVLDALTRKEGTLLYATDQDTVYLDNGSALAPLGGNFVTSSNQNISAGGTAAINLVVGLQMLRVTGSSGPQVMANAPFGSSAPADGVEIQVIGQSDTDTVSLVNSDSAKGCLLNGNVILGKADAITLQFDSILDRYCEISRNARN